MDLAMTNPPRAHNRYKKPPKGAVYIGRPTRWGNPFKVGVDGDRQAVIEKYEKWVRDQPDLIALIKKHLKGKDLVCFCAPKACHGDVLLKIANEE